jgi:SH3-like domain-containing protein
MRLSWDRGLILAGAVTLPAVAAGVWLVKGMPGLGRNGGGSGAITVAEPEKPVTGKAERTPPAAGGEPVTIAASGPALVMSPAGSPSAAPAAIPAPAPAAVPAPATSPVPAAPVPAQPSPAGEAKPAAPGAFPFPGKVTRADVYLRSGPALNYYPAGKVQSGDTLTVVGEKLGWLEVRPPAGSFSWIAKGHVRPEAGVPGKGVVTGDNVRVRAGSSITPASRDAVQGKLSRGTPVEILGEADEFYKIVPPAVATLWVYGEFVGRPAGATAAVPAPAADLPTTIAPPTGPTGPVAAVPDASAKTIPMTVVAVPPAAPQSVAPAPQPVASPAPAPAPAPDDLDGLYKAMTAELRKPVAEQDIDGLSVRFARLKATATDDRVRQYCDYYLSDLSRRRKFQDAARDAGRIRREFDEDVTRARTGGAARPAATAPASVPAATGKTEPADRVERRTEIRITERTETRTQTKEPTAVPATPAPTPAPAAPAPAPAATPAPSAPAPAAPAAPVPAPVPAAVPSDTVLPKTPAPLPVPPSTPAVPAAKPEPVAPTPSAANSASAEATGWLMTSSYWDEYKDSLGGTVRYRLVRGLPPSDLHIVWAQSADPLADLSKHVGKRVTVRGKKVYLDGHRSHLLLVTEVTEAKE